MLEEEKKFKRYLKLNGLKFTPERQIILRQVFSNHSHFEADDLLVAVRQHSKKVSKATIYRTLSHLIQSGLLREAVFGEKHAHYEHVFKHKHHEHLICLSCKKIIEFSNQKIEKLQEDVCLEHSFAPLSHRLQVFGHCADCQKSNNKSLSN